MISQEHSAWLEERGLDLELLARYGVRTTQGRVAIPYARESVAVYAKHFDPQDKSNTRCLPVGVEQTSLWNEDSLSEHPNPRDVLVVTEGEWDALSCLQAGAKYVVSLPSGAANTVDGCLEKARRALCVQTGDQIKLKANVQRFRRVLLMTDRDHDGRLMQNALTQLLEENFCLFPEYPDGCKDANDILKKFGAAALSDVMENASPQGESNYLPFSAGLKLGKPKQYFTGIEFLNEHLVFSEPEFCIIGGPASSGKSTVIQNILVNLLHHNPHLRASVFHGEGHLSIPAKRVASWYRYNINENTGDPEVQDARDRWMDERLSFIRPGGNQMPTFEWLLSAMEKHALDYGRNVLVIDPWNEIIQEKGSNQSTTEYTGECIIRMKGLADQLGLILIVGHHIAKPKERNQPPTKYDLMDSSHWANKADHVVLTWKPRDDQNKTRIEVAKSKDHGLLGRPGKVWVQLNGPKFELVQTEPPEGYSE